MLPLQRLARFGNADHTTSNKHASSESDTHGKEGQAKVKCIQRAEAAGSYESANQANRGEETLDSGAHATCRRGSYQRIDGWLDKCVDGSMNRKERYHEESTVGKAIGDIEGYLGQAKDEDEQ